MQHLGKYLIGVNAGGIASVLALIKILNIDGSIPVSILVSLIGYVAGIICIGLILIKSFARLFKADIEWTRNVERYYESEITYEGIYKPDKENTTSYNTEIFWGFSSMISFMVATCSIVYYLMII